METQPAVVADGLTKTFGGGVEALRGVTFELAYGSVLGYLGRNGSGKTTTVRILTTLTLPGAGTARVAGYDVVRHPDRVRAAIGVTLQGSALDPDMTGREHLDLVARLSGLAPRRSRVVADDLLAMLELSGAADRVIRTYSGGMQRRLDLAAALVRDPRVLFLDEPTTGLDAQSRRALWQLVRARRDAGAAVFLTTQYLEEAEALADRVVIIDRGAVVATGSPREITATTGRATLEDAFIELTGHLSPPSLEVAP